MDCQRKMRGSALFNAEGMFIFTPYHTGVKSTQLQLLQSEKYGSLWRGKKGYSIRFRFEKEHFPAFDQVLSELLTLYSTAQHDYCQSL